jgi:hypothetical protein
MEKITQWIERIQWREVMQWAESFSLSIVILIFLLTLIGISVSDLFKDIELPTWAKFNPNNSWGKAWDREKILKIALIKISQTFILIILFIFRTVWAVINALFNFFGLPLVASRR